MCGIAGLVALRERPLDPAVVDAMTATLRHRGPDDDGRYLDPDGRAALGFRRTSIVDLAGGHQPMANEDGSLWLLFNGEIYNFEALRAELERAGSRVRAHDAVVQAERSVEEVAEGADCLVLLVDHAAYRALDPAALAPRMRRPVVVDTRAFLDHPAWRAAGFEVVRLGVGTVESSVPAISSEPSGKGSGVGRRGGVGAN